jgi:hypothetical protein
MPCVDDAGRAYADAAFGGRLLKLMPFGKVYRTGPFVSGVKRSHRNPRDRESNAQEICKEIRWRRKTMLACR